MDHQTSDSLKVNNPATAPDAKCDKARYPQNLSLWVPHLGRALLRMTLDFIFRFRAVRGCLLNEYLKEETLGKQTPRSRLNLKRH